MRKLRHRLAQFSGVASQLKKLKLSKAHDRKWGLATVTSQVQSLLTSVCLGHDPGSPAICVW